MVKRIGRINGVKLYDIIKSRDNVIQAVKEACRDHARDPAVIRIRENPDKYADAVCDILEKESYYPSGFKFKRIFERGKWRNLCYTRTFPDRIIHHAIFRVVSPILMKGAIRDTYAAIPGKGLHLGTRNIHKDLVKDVKGTRYIFKMDIYHYFDSIKRALLFEMLTRRLKCRCTLSLLSVIVFQCPGEDGLPIGLYSSQILSAFYLFGFDHYCKERLRLKKYARYADDIVFMGDSKRMMWRYFEFMRRYLSKIGLEVKSNYALFPIEKRRLDFMGYVHDHSQIMIRKRNKISYIRVCNSIVRKLRRKEPITGHDFMSVNSYEGMLSWCDSAPLIEKYSGRVWNAIDFGVEAI